jgi:hypothetical protein
MRTVPSTRLTLYVDAVDLVVHDGLAFHEETGRAERIGELGYRVIFHIQTRTLSQQQ